MNVITTHHFVVALSEDEQFIVDPTFDTNWAGKINRLEFSTNTHGQVIAVKCVGRRVLKSGFVNDQQFTSVIFRGKFNDFQHYPVIQRAVNQALGEQQ